MNEFSTLSIRLEEVQMMIKSMHSTKASGIDGFLAFLSELSLLPLILKDKKKEKSLKPSFAFDHQF